MHVSLSSPVFSYVESFRISQLSKSKSIAQQHISAQPDPIFSHYSLAWKKFKDCFAQKSLLKHNLDLLSVPDFDLSLQWSQNSQTILTALKSPDYQKLAPVLRQIIKKLNDEQLNALLNEVAFACIADFPAKSTLLDNCLKLLTLGEFNRFLKDSFHDFSGVDELASKMVSELAEAFKEPILSSSKREQKPYLMRLFNHLIETLLSAFSFFKAGSRSEGPFQANYLLATYRDLFITFPLQIFILMNLCLANTTTALIATIALVTAIFALAIIYVNKFKPCPEAISHCKNLLEEAQHLRIKPVYGRENDLAELIAQLKRGKDRVKRHTIVVGDSGVGKSELFNALALYILEGRDPFFKDKILFKVDVPSLSHDNFGNTDKVKNILDQIENHEENIIVFLDELAAALKGSGEMGDRLIDLFDRLPYMAGAMIEEDYKKYVAPNEVFRRRTQPLYLRSTGKKETLEVLQHALEQEETYLSQNLLENIYEATSKQLTKSPQPFISLQVLYEAIDHHKKSNRDYASQYERLQAIRVNIYNQTRVHYTLAAQIKKSEKIGLKALEEIKKQYLFGRYYINQQLNQQLAEALAKAKIQHDASNEGMVTVIEQAVAKEEKVASVQR